MQGWYQNDIATFEGFKMATATSQFGLSQIIKEPTHILSNSASCIDLNFASRPNLVMHLALVWHLSVTASELAPSNSLRKIQPCFLLSFTFEAIGLALSASKYRSY